MNKNFELFISESIILSELQRKSAIKSDFAGYIELFNTFRTIVAMETRFIVQTFPEYTPHDEEFHLKRLFGLADKILGENIISTLNATELLILSLAVYGHDWGMAVSIAEKSVITGTEELNEGDKDLYLENELEKYKLYQLDAHENMGTSDDQNWQEYVRMTHAMRSAVRVNKYFNNIDNGIGQATARVCIGHWLDYRNLRDSEIYPTHYIVKGESINLRALSLYLRLVDLFDLSNERTPFVIYKYTAPKSLRSQMEWAKHKAVNSLTTLNYQSSRIIQVDGQTNDYQVYAALTDLKLYCQEQLRLANELFAEMDGRFHLNIFDLKWNIIPVNFDPISIKFEFDRTRMFEVLSDEIYQGDKYVFLRELLQNSIDAIRLRKELVEKQAGYKLNNFGKINIDVSASSDGNITVKISDNGIGMDLYIIENYLSVAGRSYYTSKEFKKLGLNIDPISRFGVGILSAFMVAESVSIETIRDRTISPDSKRITVDIPSVDQQFRIRATSEANYQPGTSVTVNIASIHFNNSSASNRLLKVTEYLKRIAGYIDIPIFIDEFGIKTVIVQKGAMLTETGDFAVLESGFKLDIENVFFPQSLKLAKDTFEIKTYSLENDLNLPGITGEVSYLIPKDPFLKLRHGGTSWPSADYTIVSDAKRLHQRHLKFYMEWARYKEHFMQAKNAGLAESSNCMSTFQCYLDGILVPKVNAPKSLEEFSVLQHGSPYLINYFNNEYFAVCFLSANFTKKLLKNISISRTNIKNDQTWDTYISPVLFEFILKSNYQKIKAENLKERALHIAQLIFIYRIPLELLIEKIGIDEFPVAWISQGGEIEFKTWGQYSDSNVYLQPLMSVWFSPNIRFAFGEQDQKIENTLTEWKGDELLIDQNAIGDEESTHRYLSVQANIVCTFGISLLPYTHRFEHFRFISSPWEDGAPLIQQVWRPTSDEDISDGSDLVELSVNPYFKIDLKDLEVFLVSLFDGLDEEFDLFPAIGTFDTPFEESLAYGISWMNFLHPFTKIFVRILCCINMRIETPTNSVAWATLVDKMRELPFFDPNGYKYSSISIEEINLVISEINEMISLNNLITAYQPLPVILFEDFVEDSIYESEDGQTYTFYNNAPTKIMSLNEFYPDILP
ncbi:ATP-binding protein [Pedobacter sp. WC2423]|uniref:HD domain-containing protein n=1 Tax=Pedobacter sp. WC2423 TaxID=3234142 RepID=UPI00346678CA